MHLLTKSWKRASISMPIVTFCLCKISQLDCLNFLLKNFDLNHNFENICLLTQLTEFLNQFLDGTSKLFKTPSRRCNILPHKEGNFAAVAVGSQCGFKCNKKELRAILWDANELLREARNNGASKRVRG